MWGHYNQYAVLQPRERSSMGKSAFFQKPEYMLYLLSAGWAAAWATWMSLLNNFAIETAHFTGVEIGNLQSLREVPGFLAFTVIYCILIISEQRLAMISLVVFGIGVAVTGYFPSEMGFYITTIIMSIGFHYHEALRDSMTMQFISKERLPLVLGKQISVRAMASLVAYGSIYFATSQLDMAYPILYAIGGTATVIFGVTAWAAYPLFKQHVPQTKAIVLRKRYWLFYMLTFLSGARRQIFIVFAGFMMVEKFGYDVQTIVLLYLVNHGVNVFLAPKIGAMIGHWGEQRALKFEYIGLIVIFTGYAFVESAYVAAALYILDHMFFAFAIGIKTYFQKIADPKDIASTASVSFTINHIAAVVIPAVFGIIWIYSPTSVFLAGAAIAAGSLLLSFNIPTNPHYGNETISGPKYDNDGHLIKT